MAGLNPSAVRPSAVQHLGASGFFGCTHTLRPRLQNQRQATKLRTVNERVLIANTKSGGHAFIGLHLAQQLLKAGHEVTILNDGEEVG